MTHFPCDDDPDELRTDWLAAIREAKAVAAQPGTARSVKREWARVLQKAARRYDKTLDPPVSSSTLWRAAREIEGR